MSVEVQGNLVNFQVREIGQTDWQTLVCTSDSQFALTNEITKRRTNCGIKASVSAPDFNASGNAVHNADPTADEVSYNDVKAWQKDQTKLEFRYLSLADAGAGLTEGEGFLNYGRGYFTESTLTASAESDGIASFSWTFEGVGFIDDFDEIAS